MSSLLIAHPPGRTTNKTEFVTTDGIGVQTCYRRACVSAAGHCGSGSLALSISLRRCGATAYTPSAVPRFTDMLLSPFPFGSRLVVRLRVLCPELRPTLLAIHSVRDTAHGFPSYGSPTTFFPWHAQLVLSPLFRFATSNQVRQSPLPRLDLHQLADDSFAGHTNELLCAVLRNYPLFRSPPTHQE